VRRSNVRLDRFLGDGLFAAAAARLLSELTEFRTRSRTLSSQQNLLPSPACSTRSRVLAELPAEGQIQESERCAVNSWPPGAGSAGSSVSGVPGVPGVSGVAGVPGVPGVPGVSGVSGRIKNQIIKSSVPNKFSHTQ
jgi:hypothetical protein